MPTFMDILKRQGLKAAINFKAERMCVKNFAACHRDAHSKGYNLCAPDWKDPWWFKWASRVEWYTRPNRNK